MVAKRTQLCCTQQSLVKFSEMFSSFGRGLRHDDITWSISQKIYVFWLFIYW